MKSKSLTSIAAMILSAAALTQPVSAVAQTKPVHYSVRLLSTLGGTAGVGNSVNNMGWVSGGANLPGDTTTHAALWRNGAITDLGTLGGPNSFVNFPVKNEQGEIEGSAETSTADPLGESFCLGVLGFNDGVTCLGFLWQNGVKAPLPPLPGGNNSQAYGINNSGQVVGVAENGIHDGTCTSPQVLQFQAVIWGPKKGQIQKLRPLSTDSNGLAASINDIGEVTGCSGTCAGVNVNSCLHAVVWKNGSPTNIGGLGPFNVGAVINNQGQVLGLSLLPDNAAYHSFLWQNGVVKDLGTLPGRPLVFPGGLNNKGQAVGHTCDATDTYCNAYIWENGVMTDLNTLIPAGVYLFYAGDINDSGEIAGVAIDPVTGATPAFLAIPCDAAHANVEGCAGGPSILRTSQSPKLVPPANVREQMQQWRGIRRWVRQ